MREQAQLEAQIADAKSSQLLLSWRLAIVGRGLDSALVLAETTPDEATGFTARAPLQLQEQPDALWDAVAVIPLYGASAADALELRMVFEIDPASLGVGIGTSDLPGHQTNLEGLW